MPGGCPDSRSRRVGSTPPLSARELDGLGCLAQGLSDKQLARVLGISDQTARTHRRNMLAKTAMPNVCALLYLAFNEGWLAWPVCAPGVHGCTD